MRKAHGMNTVKPSYNGPPLNGKNLLMFFQFFRSLKLVIKQIHSFYFILFFEFDIFLRARCGNQVFVYEC